jgi:hypothetical protein
MIEIWCKEKYRDQTSKSYQLSNTKIIDMLEKLYRKKINISNVIINSEKGSGSYLKINNNNKIDYIIFSSNTENGRNSYIAQRISTVLSSIFSEIGEITPNNINVYLFDNENDNIYNDYQMDKYRLLKTFGIKILNSKKDILLFNSVDDWILWRKKLEKKNNQSSYIYDSISENKYILFGKTFGANGKESILISLALSRVSNREFEIIPIEDNNETKFNMTDINLLDFYGIKYHKDYRKFDEKEITEKTKTARKQYIYKSNLFDKFNEKCCYLCDCKISSLIVASHIHRVTDIDNSSMTIEEKIKQTTSKDNGFWLCSNHDKMFESGILGFDTEGYLISNIDKFIPNKEYILKNTFRKKIEESHLNEDTLFYLSKHIERNFSDTDKIIRVA